MKVKKQEQVMLKLKYKKKEKGMMMSFLLLLSFESYTAEKRSHGLSKEKKDMFSMKHVLFPYSFFKEKEEEKEKENEKE